VASSESGIPHSSLRTPHCPSVFPVSDDNPFGLVPFEDIHHQELGTDRFTTKDTKKRKSQIPLLPQEGIGCYPTVVRDAVATQRPLPVTRHLPFWKDAAAKVWLYQGNCLAIMDQIAEKYPDGIFDMIFADPPYFLSNGGITCHAGKMVSVNKGDWDKSRGPEENHNFNREWLSRCQKVLKPNGTIWVSGTAHIIHSVGFAMQQLGFKLLNDITWLKPNPPPNLSCRYFTHTTETVIWAAKNEKSRHFFNYQLMRRIAGGKQMKSYWSDIGRMGGTLGIWQLLPPGFEEKAHGKHPTQKPLALLERIMLASTRPDDLVLDPFMGAGTTAAAAVAKGRRAVGIEIEKGFIHAAILRVEDVIRALEKCNKSTPDLSAAREAEAKGTGE
jgi:site-specific DNA-methyltransferase (adenine-specific)